MCSDNNSCNRQRLKIESLFFISEAIRDDLDRIVRLFGERGLSVLGLVENLARNFLETYIDDVDNTRFLAMVDKPGWTDKAKFIKSVLFTKEIKYVKYDVAAMEYYMRLTNFYSQFRAIGVNYNQVVNHLETTFTAKTALALLYKLENTTKELVATNHKIEELTREFEEKYLKKE